MIDMAQIKSICYGWAGCKYQETNEWSIHEKCCHQRGPYDGDKKCYVITFIKTSILMKEEVILCVMTRR